MYYWVNGESFGGIILPVFYVVSIEILLIQRVLDRYCGLRSLVRIPAPVAVYNVSVSLQTIIWRRVGIVARV